MKQEYRHLYIKDIKAKLNKMYEDTSGYDEDDFCDEAVAWFIEEFPDSIEDYEMTDYDIKDLVREALDDWAQGFYACTCCGGCNACKL